MGDYLNFVGKNKKVHDFSLKLGVTHWGITFFVIKKFWSAPGGSLQHFLKITSFCIKKGTLAILVIAATIFKLQKVAIDGGEDSQQVTDEAPQHFYPTLMYATGPGTKHSSYDVSRDERLRDKDFVYPSIVYRESASHQGEDVALYAVGPQSHLFNGLIDQHFIPHILGYAGCIGNGLTLCDKITKW